MGEPSWSTFRGTTTLDNSLSKASDQRCCTKGLSPRRLIILGKLHQTSSGFRYIAHYLDVAVLHKGSHKSVGARCDLGFAQALVNGRTPPRRRHVGSLYRQIPATSQPPRSTSSFAPSRTSYRADPPQPTFSLPCQIGRVNPACTLLSAKPIDDALNIMSGGDRILGRHT